jgi:hypothetical protein
MTDEEKPKEDKRGKFKCTNQREAYQQIQQLNDAGIRTYQKCDECDLKPESDECKLFRKSFPDACEKYQPPGPTTA